MELGRSGWKRLTAESSEAVSRSAPEQPPTPAREHELTTVIDAGCEIDGALVLQKSIRIEGEFRGSLESSGTVTVGTGAAVQADIRARSVLIFGAVVGDVRGSREVVIHAQGRLHGDVETPSLVIERGAFFNGQTRMFRPERIARASASTQVAPDLVPSAAPQG